MRIHANNFVCTGSEELLTQCYYDKTQRCTLQSGVAGVKCEKGMHTVVSGVTPITVMHRSIYLCLTRIAIQTVI